jgi:hypothetical protein
VIGTYDLATIELEAGSASPAPRRRRRRVDQAVLAVACAAVVVAVVSVVISQDDDTTTVDTPLTTLAVGPFEQPPRDEIRLASNTDTYLPGSGPIEVTAARRYVSLRTCAVEGNPDGRCDGSQRWAYVTGSADALEEHYGLLGIADDLVLSALDDRYFVASAVSSSAQDPQSAQPAWLIDSVTGQRGALTWQVQPTTLNSVEQELVLFPVTHLIPDDGQSGPGFLPRVVDKRDWTISPLSVPAVASPALAIHQPGSGRIWIGTAPDGGDVGLAYTDDGGASWTGVELPEALVITSEELLQSVATTGKDGSFVAAATGDHVAVTAMWDSEAGDLVVSADAGENWNTIALDPIYGDGRGLFVLSDDRLLLVSSRELGEASGRPGQVVAKTLRVSRSAADWSQLERSISSLSDAMSVADTAVVVNQQRVVVLYDARGPTLSPTLFSTDLNETWTIPERVVTGQPPLLACYPDC